MSMETEALEKLLSFAFVMSENMVGLTKGDYDKDTFIKKTYEYLHNYNVDFRNKLKLEQALHRLEHIENANPSKALELVGYLKDYHLNAIPYYDWLNEIEKYILKAQEQEKTKVVGGRTFGKDILNLKQTIEQCKDKPIFYVSRTYGNKYIVPQKQFDDLTNENVEYKRVLEILFKKQVDLSWLWYCIHECVDSLNEYNKKMPIEKFKLTQEEFNSLKKWSKGE